MPVQTRSMTKQKQEEEEEMKFEESKVTYRKRVEYIVNLTTEEYFVSKSVEDRENKMKILLTKLDKGSSIIKESIGTSRWDRSDTIKLISKNDKPLCKYIKGNYSVILL